MQENKYYTPNIEDLFVGYEFQYRSITTAHWAESAYHTLWYDMTDDSKIDDYFDLEAIRTKYLDKEDIESEGWTYTTILVEDDEEDDHFVDGYAKNMISTDGLDRWYTLEEFSNNRIKIVYGYYNNSVSQTWKTLFEGKCPSLNELRKVSKLLGI